MTPVRAPGQMLRFFLTAVAGLVVDLAVASALGLVLGVRDQWAAAAGLLAGMVFNYFVHMHWTFRGHGQSASVGHFLTFAAGVAVTLVLRVGILSGIEALGWQDWLHPTLRLGLAAGVAFGLSYVINSRLVFRLKDGGAPR